MHAHVCALCCVSSLMCLQRLRYQWLAGKEAHIVVFCQKKKYNTMNLTSLPRLHGQRLVGPEFCLRLPGSTTTGHSTVNNCGRRGEVAGVGVDS